MTAAPLRPQHGTPPEVFQIGVQYYISARAAVRHDHGGVAGNLFHHAFEMMLRGVLLDKSVFTVPELRKKYGNRHDLPGLWIATKEALPRPARNWSHFDSFISQLHKWDRIRFGGLPDGVPKVLLVDYANAIKSLWGAQRISKVLRVDNVQNSATQSSEPGSDLYRLGLEDADELFAVLVGEMGWDEPVFVREKLIGDAAIRDYEWWNRYVIGEPTYPRSFE